MTRARDVANLIGSGNYSSTTFTATAGQTAFTISHTQGFVQVFMNGLLLDETVDYTSNGSAVTLTSGAAAGDEIEVVAYNTFSVGDALNQAAADTRYVNTAGDTMTGNLGIGGSPSVNLDVRSSGNTFALVKNTSSGSGLYIKADTDGDSEIQTAGGNNNIIFRASGVERMQIDSSGRVTTPYQPFIECTGDNNNSASFAANAVFDHWTNRTTPVGITRSGGRFTVPVVGNYLFTYTIYTYTTAAGHYRIHLKKNGNVHMMNQLEISTGSRIDGSHDFTVSASLILKMSANDYVEIVAADAMQIYEGVQHNALSMMLIG